MKEKTIGTEREEKSVTLEEARIPFLFNLKGTNLNTPMVLRDG
jgi:hypothetical protein